VALQPEPERAGRRCQEGNHSPRKKEASNSPDISKLIMNQVIEEIEKEGLTRRWCED